MNYMLCCMYEWSMNAFTEDQIISNSPYTARLETRGTKPEDLSTFQLQKDINLCITGEESVVADDSGIPFQSCGTSCGLEEVTKTSNNPERFQDEVVGYYTMIVFLMFTKYYSEIFEYVVLVELPTVVHRLYIYIYIYFYC